MRTHFAEISAAVIFFFFICWDLRTSSLKYNVSRKTCSHRGSWVTGLVILLFYTMTMETPWKQLIWIKSWCQGFHTQTPAAFISGKYIKSKFLFRLLKQWVMFWGKHETRSYFVTVQMSSSRRGGHLMCNGLTVPQHISLWHTGCLICCLTIHRRHLESLFAGWLTAGSKCAPTFHIESTFSLRASEWLFNEAFYCL